MKIKILIYFIVSILTFSSVKGQIILPNSEFDSSKKGPTIIYYNFYNGIQLIEIDYNNYEKARIDFQDAMRPISGVRQRNYSNNTIISRNKNGQLLHQYNLRNKPFIASDFQKIDSLLITISHASKIKNEHLAQSNYPSYGKYNLYVTENDKAGIIDTLGNSVVEIKYDGIQAYSWCNEKNTYELFNNTDFSKMVFTLQINRKWGFTDGKIMIQPKYEELIPIKKNVLRVRKSNKYGLLDFNEHLILYPAYSNLVYKNNFYLYANKVSKIDSDGTVIYGIMNSAFQIVTKPIYKNLEKIIKNGESSTKYWACKTSGFGAIDINGKEISSFKYDSLLQNPYGKYYRTTSFDGSKAYILDLNFNEIGSQYDLIYDWNNLLFIVKKDTKFGLLNLKNEIILPCEYESIWETTKNDTGSLRKNDKYGIVNSIGQITIPCLYDDVYFSFDGRIIASIFDTNKILKRGLLETNGIIIIPFIYDEIQWINNDSYKVKLNDKYGILDKEGKEISPVKYDEIYQYSNGFCIAKIGFGYGYLNKFGKEITHFYYDKATDFQYNSENNLTAKVYLNGKEIEIDINGKKLN